MNKAVIKERIKVAQCRLELYIDAEQAILSGQSYSVEGLQLTRANLLQVQNMIRALTNEIEALTSKLNKTNKHRRVIIPQW